MPAWKNQGSRLALGACAQDGQLDYIQRVLGLLVYTSVYCMGASMGKSSIHSLRALRGDLSSALGSLLRSRHTSFRFFVASCNM